MQLIQFPTENFVAMQTDLTAEKSECNREHYIGSTSFVLERLTPVACCIRKLRVHRPLVLFHGTDEVP
jgi:hypothetical protein